MDENERPTFRELYEKQTERIGNIENRLTRHDKFFIVLTIAVFSPKLVGLNTSELIPALIRAIIGG